MIDNQSNLNCSNKTRIKTRISFFPGHHFDNLNCSNKTRIKTLLTYIFILGLITSIVPTKQGLRHRWPERIDSTRINLNCSNKTRIKTFLDKTLFSRLRCCASELTSIVPTKQGLRQGNTSFLLYTPAMSTNVPAKQGLRHWLKKTNVDNFWSTNVPAKQGLIHTESIEIKCTFADDYIHLSILRRK